MPLRALEEISDESIHPVQAAKMVVHLLPVWVMLLMFAVIFQQPTTFFTKQMNDNEEEHWQEFQNPTDHTPKCNYLVDYYFNAIVRHVFHHSRSHFYKKRKGNQCYAKNWDQDVPLDHSHGSCSSYQKKETPNL
ncbi:Uncharacterized protein Adt_05571 [Abeliophyllum distichum]|uniref:Uncharacterized protein n=1 Tax=Abeliophyllum distichum TaxID=126358 RepID=A0ABD1V6J9_9LAMI